MDGSEEAAPSSLYPQPATKHSTSFVSFSDNEAPIRGKQAMKPVNILIEIITHKAQQSECTGSCSRVGSGKYR